MRARGRGWVLTWFDRVTLGAAAVALLVWAAVGARPLHPVEAAEAADALTALEGFERRGEPRVGLAAPGDAAARLRRALGSAGVPAAAPLPGWVLHKRPGLLFEVAAPPPPPPLVHLAPGLRRVGVERGRVEVEASLPRLTRLTLIGLTLERREGDGPWIAVGTLDPSAPRWVDRAVLPERTYGYRVVSRAQLDREDPAVEAAGLAAAPSELLARVSDEVRATLPADVRFVLTSVTLPDPARGRAGSAQLAIERWDPTREAFRRRWVLAAVGDALGDTGWTLAEVGVERAGERPGSRAWALLRRGTDQRRLAEGAPGLVDR